MTYDQLYQNQNNAWGKEPDGLINLVLPSLKPGSAFLDLGCGQGKDALFMAKNNFQVTAIDSSEVAINQLDKTAENEGLKNLTSIKVDVRNFQIEKNKYDIIYGGNVLQFLKKDEAKKIIEHIKENVAPDGFVILTSFTTDDQLYDKSKENRTFFEPREMLNFFKDFKIIHYFENKITDQGHASAPEPHQHGVVRIIAQKQ